MASRIGSAGSKSAVANCGLSDPAVFAIGVESASAGEEGASSEQSQVTPIEEMEAELNWTGGDCNAFWGCAWSAIGSERQQQFGSTSFAQHLRAQLGTPRPTEMVEAGTSVDTETIIATRAMSAV